MLMAATRPVSPFLEQCELTHLAREPIDVARATAQHTGCLHLKSAVTALAEESLLLNPAWVSAAAFPDHEAVFVDDREPYAANALCVAGTIIHPSQFPRTRDRLSGRGLRLAAIYCSELAKAEGAVTCCSLIFEA